jgi:hypothetical protein
MIRTGIQKMNQKPEGDTEDQIPPGRKGNIPHFV